MLSVQAIDVAYGDVQVLWGVSLEVKAGEVVALIGGNGAGKTTTLLAISALQPPRRGSIVYDGQPIQARAPHELVGLGLAHVPEGRRLFPDMNVRDNLLLGALRGEARRRRADTLEKMFALFPRLKERQKQHAGTLSGGEQQMAAIARGLMSLPRLLMLDEPTLGLAPLMVDEVFRVVRQVHAEGVTVLLVEQNVFRSLEVADRAYVLENGRVVMSGSGASLLADGQVREAYLGL